MNAVTAEPVAGAFVEVQFEAETLWVDGPHATGADGSVRVLARPPTKATVVAYRAVDQFEFWAEQRLDLDHGAGSVVVVVKLDLRPGSLDGRVVDESGQPIPSAIVEVVRRRPARPATRAYQAWSEQPYQRAVTDSAGRFNMDGLPAGPDHTVRAHRDGFGWVIRAPVTVVASERRSIDLTMHRDVVVRGVVSFPAGVSRPDWCRVLGIVLENAAGPDGASTEMNAREPVTPDGDGRFEISASNAYRVVLVGRAQGYAPVTVEVEARDARAHPERGVEIRFARAGARLSGQVTDESGAPRRAEVAAYRAGEILIPHAIIETSANGAFLIDSLEPGVYRLVARSLEPDVDLIDAVVPDLSTDAAGIALVLRLAR